MYIVTYNSFESEKRLQKISIKKAEHMTILCDDQLNKGIQRSGVLGN